MAQALTEKETEAHDAGRDVNVASTFWKGEPVNVEVAKVFLKVSARGGGVIPEGITCNPEGAKAG